MDPLHSQHRKRTLGMVGVLHAFTHVYTVALLPLYLQIQQDFRLPGIAYATLLVTVMGLAYVLPSYSLGVLADRVSRKSLLGIGLGLNAVGFIGLALSPTYALAVVFVVLAGLGGSFYHPAATSLIVRLFPEARGRALGLVGVGASAGFFVGPIYCGWRAAAANNWRAPVLELGIAGLIFAILFLWLADEEKGEPTTASKRLAAPTPGHKSLFPSAKLLMLFLAATLVLSLRDFAGQAMGTASSLFLQKAQGFDPRHAGVALSCVFIMSAISNPLFGHLSDRARLRWASVVLSCGALLAASVPHLAKAFVIPAFLGYGFFFMASYPITEAALMEAVPDEVRGRVFGLFMTVGGLIGNFSHWVIGEWVGSLGRLSLTPGAYHSIFALLGVMILLSLGAFPFLHALRRAERIGDSPPPVPETISHSF